MQCSFLGIAAVVAVGWPSIPPPRRHVRRPVERTCSGSDGGQSRVFPGAGLEHSRSPGSDVTVPAGYRVAHSELGISIFRTQKGTPYTNPHNE
jgi:hypothetical protein